LTPLRYFVQLLWKPAEVNFTAQARFAIVVMLYYDPRHRTNRRANV
jgi:hypothetical protein